jgi:hypothetical protein
MASQLHPSAERLVERLQGERAHQHQARDVHSQVARLTVVLDD